MRENERPIRAPLFEKEMPFPSLWNPIFKNKKPHLHFTPHRFNFDIFVFCFSPEMYHLLAMLVLLASAAGDGNFHFTSTHIAVAEAPFTQASFGISRTGSMTDGVVLTCRVGVYISTCI